MFAVDFGESRRRILDIEAERAAFEGAEFRVAEGVETEHAEQGGDADGEGAEHFGALIFCLERTVELSGGNAAEHRERE